MIPIPVELLDHIASYLWYDSSSLLAISLCSQSWRSACRPYVFRRITINTECRHQELLGLIEDTPAIAHWVRELRIRESLPGEADLAWVPSIAISMAKNLKKVYSLEFVDLYVPLEKMKKYASTELFLSMPSFKAVTRLSFVRCQFHRSFIFSLIALLVSSLPNIHDLHYHDISCVTAHYHIPMETDAIDAGMHSYLAHIPAVHFHTYDSGIPFPWLPNWFMSTQAPGCRSYSFHTSRVSDLPKIGRVIQGLGGALHQVELRFINSNKWRRDHGSNSMFGFIVSVNVLLTVSPVILHSISFSKNPQLHSINLHDPSHPVVVPLLASIASPSVLELKFSIAFENTCKFRKKKVYDNLEAILLSPRYANLLNVYFVYTGSLRLAVVSGKVHHIFNSLSRRVHLHVLAAEPSQDPCT
ncbi:uncharacterized protein FIBRA_05464 [Fibroporia radiculosa]|uniref:F-box domain-containing protein n=1 Tax=Fibroporia radiculosa TaxID=599839 RepID=J4GR21_9APHY|nr:uncharacterized protein FIBRA_05464 [Fibroporia radiculosa]CCM03335.1 predicted protein [Fibroporia radiculosa]